MKHEYQHKDGGDDWCIHCGEFSCYVREGDDCSAKERDKFDSRKPDNFQRMYEAMFGATAGLTRKAETI